MPTEGLLVLGVICIAVMFYFRRELLQLAIIAAALVGLTFIWKIETQGAGLKVALTLAMFVVIGAVVKKLKLDENRPAIGPGAKRSGSKYKPMCGTCNGTGRMLCYACSGSGQGPGGLGNVLGKSVSCFHCSGTGYVQCNCR